MTISVFIALQAQDYVSVPIYEFGSPVRDYEDNFKNLVSNWNKEHITNAGDYKLNEIYLLETISGHERYNYWRNYFSSGKPVHRTISSKKSVSTDYSSSSAAKGIRDKTLEFVQEELNVAKKRMQRFGIILERFISPEGTFPLIGRSMT